MVRIVQQLKNDSLLAADADPYQFQRNDQGTRLRLAELKDKANKTREYIVKGYRLK